MEYVPLASIATVDVNKGGTIKIIKKLIWVQGGKLIHLVVLHMLKALC